MKHLPLTDDVVKMVEELNTKVWAAVNGHPLDQHDLVQVGYLLGEIKRYGRYSQDGSCPSAIYHGPGHQSRTECDLPPGHTGIHRGDGRGWAGLVAFTGYFDEEEDD